MWDIKYKKNLKECHFESFLETLLDNHFFRISLLPFVVKKFYMKHRKKWYSQLILYFKALDVQKMYSQN